MSRRSSLLLSIWLNALLLAGCSGIRQTSSGGGGGGTGNANLTMTLSDTPPTNTAFVNFNVPISGISLTPSTGTDVNVISSSTLTVEMTRLQSDSAGLGTFSVPAGTYSALNVLVNNSPSGVFVNASGATIGSCTATQVTCNLSGTAPGKITIDLKAALGGQGLVLTNNQNLALGLDFNLNNAITTVGGIAIDLTQPKVFSVVTLPRTGQATGTVDSIEDFTGTVTAVSGNTVTVTSATRGVLVGTATSSTIFNDPTGTAASVCQNSVTISCVATGRTVSLDSTLDSAGKVTLTEVDFIDLPSVDEIEGMIFPTSTAGHYALVVSEKIAASGNTVLAPVGSGTILDLTLDPSVTFSVDIKDLPLGTPAGFAGAADILPGQTVMARVKSASQGTPVSVVADRLLLRYTRLSGTVATAGTAFSLNAPSAFTGPFLTPPFVQTYIPQTTFDGVASVNVLANGDAVSVRALHVHSAPAFLAKHVRKH